MVVQHTFAKVTALILSAVVAISSLGFASPARASTYDGLNGTIDCSSSGTAMIVNNVVTSQNNCAGAIEILGGVTAIGNEVSQFNDTVTSITIPATTTSIGDFAFSYASALQIVNFGNASQLMSIGESAFDSATSLTSITIQSSLTSVGDYAFYGATSLSSIYFLENAPSVGTSAFNDLVNVAKAYIKRGATGFASPGQIWNGLVVEQVVEEEQFTVTYDSALGSAVTQGSFRTGESIATATGSTIQTEPISTRPGYTLSGWASSTNGSVIDFPFAPAAISNITLYAIWQLNNGAFKCTTGSPIFGDDQSPTYIITNGEVTQGNNCAGAVVFPSGITTIGYFAFYNTSALTSITIPATFLNIKNYAFKNASA